MPIQVQNALPCQENTERNCVEDGPNVSRHFGVDDNPEDTSSSEDETIGGCSLRSRKTRSAVRNVTQIVSHGYFSR